MRYHYRCTNKKRGGSKYKNDCGRRKTLNHLVHDLHCEHCGAPMKYDPAVKRWNKNNLCRCDGAHYPHMKGSLPLCVHYSKVHDDEYYRQQDAAL